MIYTSGMLHYNERDYATYYIICEVLSANAR